MKTASFLRGFAWLTALAGVAIAMGLAHAETRRARIEHRTAFEAEARLLLEAVQNEAALYEDLLRSVRHLHALSDAIEPAAFEEFAAKGLRFHETLLGGYAFAQVIPDAVRLSMDSTAPGAYPILEPDGSGGVRPAERRPGYVRVSYQRPAAFTEWPVGFDLAALEPFREAMRAVRSPNAFALAWTSKADPGGPKCFLLAPIFSESDAADMPGGFAMARVDPERLVATATERAHSKNMTVRLLPPGPSMDASDGWEGDVHFGGLLWRLRVDSTGIGFSRRHVSGKLGLPLAVIFIGLLAAGLLRVVATRAAAVERLVDERTNELRGEMVERERLEIETAEAGRRERERMGRELHDSIGQKLSAAAMLARAVSRKLDETQAEEAEDARLLAGLVKESAAQARQIAHGLAPVELPGGGLAEALHRLAGETHSATGLDCDFIGDAEAPDLDPAVALQLYRIAQEAVTNALRHAQARSIHIRLARENGSLRLQIEDDGLGIGKPALSPGGLGLRLMKRRAAMIAGSLEIRSGSAGGVCVECRFRPEVEKIPVESSPETEACP